MTEQPMTEQPMTEKATKTRKDRPLLGRIIVVGAVTVALALFVVQNTADTGLSWLFFDATGPLWIVIVVAAVAGAVLSEMLGWMVRRSRRRRT